MTTIHVAHSPDSDDAFMFYALAAGKIDTEGLTYVHELQDIESLNQRAMRGELEVTAVSIHAYAYLSDQYSLLPHGASMGDRYGPRSQHTARLRCPPDASISQSRVSIEIWAPDPLAPSGARRSTSRALRSRRMAGFTPSALAVFTAWHPRAYRLTRARNQIRPMRRAVRPRE